MIQTLTLFKIFKFMLLVRNQCFSLTTEDERVRKVEETSLKCSYDEVFIPRQIHKRTKYTCRKNN